MERPNVKIFESNNASLNLAFFIFVINIAVFGKVFYKIFSFINIWFTNKSNFTCLIYVVVCHPFVESFHSSIAVM